MGGNGDCRESQAPQTSPIPPRARQFLGPGLGLGLWLWLQALKPTREQSPPEAHSQSPVQLTGQSPFRDSPRHTRKIDLSKGYHH